MPVFLQTVRRQMWSPWPGIAEVLAMASLALMWIQATYKASSQQRRAATAALLDSADAPHSKTGSSSSTSGRSPQQPAVLEHGGVPKPIAAVLMVPHLPHLTCMFSVSGSAEVCTWRSCVLTGACVNAATWLHLPLSRVASCMFAISALQCVSIAA